MTTLYYVKNVTMNRVYVYPFHTEAAAYAHIDNLNRRAGKFAGDLVHTVIKVEQRVMTDDEAEDNESLVDVERALGRQADEDVRDYQEGR